MRVSQILRIPQKTQNLVAVSSKVSVQDLLLVVRHAAQKLCHLGYVYINSRTRKGERLSFKKNEGHPLVLQGRLNGM